MPKEKEDKMNFLIRNALVSFFFIQIIFVDRGLGLNKDDCKESKCSRHGPAIRFPFRIKGLQPDHCAYPEVGFDLSCTEKKETVLVLPNSVKLLVKTIDYASQVIHASDPENCLPRQLSNLNLSASPFQYLELDQNTQSHVLFNCTWRKNPFFQVPCLSAPNYQVYIFSSTIRIDSPDLMYCTKMYDVSLPENMIFSNDYVLQLTWFNPSCGSCAIQGKYCRLKANNTQPETECSGELKRITWAAPKFLVTGIIFGMLLVVLMGFALYRIYIFDKIEKEYQSRIEKFLDDYKAFKPGRYSYSDIKRITNQFKEELGKGAYGTVFKGKLSDEILVAVKVLNNSKGNGEEFVNEVRTIGRIHHANVVRFIGFCADGFRRALVYEYLPNDSLEKFISSADAKNHFLGWKRILHFDIKPQNILLDHNFNPKISDFGLAKLCSKDQSAVSMTTARGTIGYIAPEVFSRNFGNVSFKSDVYSFGMLVLEMVGGRKSVDGKNEKGHIYFPEWIYNLLEVGEDLRLEFEEEEDAMIAKKLAIVGLWCSQWNPVDRPTMKSVIQMLEGEGDNLSVPPNPFSSVNPRRMNARIQRYVEHDLGAILETE
ncbi:receptor serine/threonine kinase, putative [Ricinus communis]|uniref:Receptor serine/threonine kinase, putative n=1 Tax=Ricinus communis TaxID=3988 RepID=B9SUU6_RICCO|nr:receptor serine/threonine kinase, putative [Ricinus communis]